MRAVRWPFWAALAVVTAVFGALEPFYAGKPVDNTLFDIGTVGTFTAAALVILSYTIIGLAGPFKWWRNDVGTIVICGAFAMIPVSGPLAWAVIWRHGMLVSPPAVWTEVGGWYLAWGGMLALGLLALRARQQQLRAPARKETETASTPEAAP